MNAFYDNYDYSSYWTSRNYENESEVVAIQEFLKKIKNIDRAIEIGAGFGRLVPSYAYRAKSVVMTEPSIKLLNLAKTKLKMFKNIKFLQSTIENLPKRVRPYSFDLVVMVRVMHHLENPKKTFEEIERLTCDNGYLILEFANKIHFKNVVQNFLKGNFGFINDTTTIDIRSEKSKKQKTINFLNYHPEVIKSELVKNNFEIIEVRSVSNIRSPFLKKHIPQDLLLQIERILQKPLSYISFGPSIFVLARKKG